MIKKNIIINNQQIFTNQRENPLLIGETNGYKSYSEKKNKKKPSKVNHFPSPLKNTEA